MVREKLHLTELNRLTLNEFRQAFKRPVDLILLNIRSAGNVGSMFRSADAFRIHKIWLCGISPQPPDRELSKTALGAEKSVSWEYRSDALALIQELKEQGFHILAVEHTNESTPLDKLEPLEQPVVFVLGNEVFGIDDSVLNHCDACIEIPQFGTKHSLNVSVCAGIVLWHYTHQLTVA
jgi:23S rRNA (guanosine2251-2'-O)-methyltransferase